MRRFVPLAIALSVSAMPAWAGSGYDTGVGPGDLVERLGIDTNEARRPIGEWLRIRGFAHAPVRKPNPPSRALTGEEMADAAELEVRIEETRSALSALRGAGYRGVVLLRWEREWPSGARRGAATGNRSPLDLREAYRRGFALAATYGDLVDAWEIENEPDAGFFADNADVFGAFYKAVALGLAAGRREPAAARGDEESATGWAELGEPAGWCANGLIPWRRPGSLIVMPPLVLPPGPYLAQLKANGFLAYTEGANLHYYGFADDYSGAHLRLREALGEGWAAEDGPATRRNGFRLGKPGALARPTYPQDGVPPARRLPVFVTEWGYPRLDGYSAQTVEGRLRQWRFYREVTLQNERLGVRAPMAFFLLPYHEYGAKEFGLTMPRANEREAHFGFRVEADAGAAKPTESTDGATNRQRRDEAGLFSAGGLDFAPADFGARRTETWMARIGERVGDDEAAPALAWLMDRAEQPRRPEREPRGPRARAESVHARTRGDWLVRTETPSPVVLDLVAGTDTQAVKSFCGYIVGSADGVGDGRGRARLVVYNFGDSPATLRVVWPAGMRPAAAAGVASAWRLELAEGERREIPVELSVPGDAWAARELVLVAEVENGDGRTLSRWATRLYPHPAGLRAADARSLVFPAGEAADNRAQLLGEQAAEEAKVAAQGRWLVTPGVVVEETPSRWRFHVSALPPEPMRPARAELPLPDSWAPWERGLVMSFAYRAVPEPGAAPLRPDDPDPRRRPRAGNLGDTLEFLLRTRAGNVYCVQAPLRPKPEWAPYNQPAETLTPGFPGRQAAPLRISEEGPASLVFFFRPAALPAIYEIDRPALSHWRRPE